MSVVIEISELSKQYRLGTKEKESGTITHSLINALAAPFRNYRRIRNLSRASEDAEDVFWALKDVSFNVEKGQVVGVIGRNGAGKSTLLKILSRITEPTRGSVRIQGRIASLLEVGTGFHPELSGRENVYMNGTILGMTKREIDLKFDEIVEFSGVEKFIDTAVKFYSSGMKVRLGFAVAAHLNPEILIVDEVLAVGDAEFQKKAIGKMKDVTTNGGRTVLFVSHNIAAIKSLCTHGVFLERGKVQAHGEIRQVVDAYNRSFVQDNVSLYGSSFIAEPTHEILNVLSCKLSNEMGEEQLIFSTQQNISVTIQYEILKSLKGGLVNFSVENTDQVVFMTFDTDLHPELLDDRNPGLYESVISIPRTTLKPGRYFVTVRAGIANFSTFAVHERCLAFQVVLDSENETFISYAEKRAGVIAMPLSWVTSKIRE